MNTIKRDSKGKFIKGNYSGKRFTKGEHPSKNTEFKKGNMAWKNANTKKSQWKKEGEKPYYLKEWNKKEKEKIRQRDNYICQECGIHQDELSGRNKKLDVHHVDGNKQNNNTDNLITLCRECHSRTHGLQKHKLLIIS